MPINAINDELIFCESSYWRPQEEWENERHPFVSHLSRTFGVLFFFSSSYRFSRLSFDFIKLVLISLKKNSKHGLSKFDQWVWNFLSLFFSLKASANDFSVRSNTIKDMFMLLVHIVLACLRGFSSAKWHETNLVTTREKNKGEKKRVDYDDELFVDD
jgi:hypothetical protein